MPNSRPKEIVYLLGAGATHAEIMFSPSGRRVKEGLTNSAVSERVIRKICKNNPNFFKRYIGAAIQAIPNPNGGSDLMGPHGKVITDIELLITMLESSKHIQAKRDAHLLRKAFQEDILSHLKKGRRGMLKPTLIASLLEYHKLNEDVERLSGVLTLNYDSIFEDAVEVTQSFTKYDFDYGLDISRRVRSSRGYGIQANNKFPLLKMHGSFDWQLDKKTNRLKAISTRKPLANPEWLPPGMAKEYHDYPYNILFGKAKELLTKCDELRIIGCSLSLYDIKLLTLLFKTKTFRKESIPIDLIIPEQRHKKIIENRLALILPFKPSFYNEIHPSEHTDNPLLDWLLLKSSTFSSTELSRTTFLKTLKSKVIRWKK